MNNQVVIDKVNHEFIILMALMTSVMALSIDTILPAMSNMAVDLNISEQHKVQYIISVLFLGFGIGQLLFGPLSDSIGRKKPIYLGGSVFALGCIISFFSTNLPFMLLGRFLQGFGASSYRTISIAVIRDKYNGGYLDHTIPMRFGNVILKPY